MAASAQPLSWRRQCWLAARTLALWGVFLGLFAWGYHWLAHWYAAGQYDAVELARMGDLEALEELARYRPQRLLVATGTYRSPDELAYGGLRDPSESNGYEGTLLHAATSRHQLAVAHFLLHHGAEVNALDETRRPPLLVALSGITGPPTAHVGGGPRRLMPGVGSREPDPSPYVFRADVDMVRLLLSHGADPNRGEKYPPLVAAVYANNPAAIVLLLGRGANVNGRGLEGVTALHMAASWGHRAVMELLLNRGADVNALDDFGRPALFWAVINRDVRTARLLLSRGADLDVATKSGFTLLHVAAADRMPSIQLVFLLVARGADVNAAGEGGWTPLFCAPEAFSPYTARLLIECGADVNCADSEGRTPLHCAARVFVDETVAVLLAYGAAVNARDQAGQTPLDLARGPEVQAVLKKHGARHGWELPAPAVACDPLR